MNTLPGRLSQWLATALYGFLCKTLFASYRISFRGEGQSVLDEGQRRDAPFIAAFWSATSCS